MIANRLASTKQHPCVSRPGTGTAWLLPLVDGVPPTGWDGAAPYLVLPVLLVVAQWASSAVLSPIDPNDENAKTQTAYVWVTTRGTYTVMG